MDKEVLKILSSGCDKVLYKIKDKSITYEECYQKVLELSNNLKKQGTAPIIIYGHKSIEEIISILSCVVAKRCYIPIDLYTPIERINEIILSSKATLLIKNEEINIDICETLTIAEINNKYQNRENNSQINNNINAYIIYTSGSTGSPKGVPISYENLSNFISWITNIKELDIKKDINILSQASYSFDLSVMDIYYSLYKKKTIVAIDREIKGDLKRIYNTISEENINFLILTPTFIKMLLLNEEFNSKNYMSLEYIFFCGEILETETVKKIRSRFPYIHIINAYGPTEGTCSISLVEITNEMLNEKYLPVGIIDKSAVNIEIKNEEIILKGLSIFSGYLNIKSNNCYQENGINCYKTGDIGYIKNNYLYCLGRKDNQIKYQGYRIELGDIEANLLKIKGVREAIVIAKYKEDTKIVKLIKAFVVLDKNLTEEDIKKELSSLIPDYMIPKTIVELDSIPMNNSNKYDRKKLELL